MTGKRGNLDTWLVPDRHGSGNRKQEHCRPEPKFPRASVTHCASKPCEQGTTDLQQNKILELSLLHNSSLYLQKILITKENVIDFYIMYNYIQLSFGITGRLIPGPPRILKYLGAQISNTKWHS